MIFRKANEKDLPALRSLYESVKGTPFCTWNEFYPGEIDIQTDLAAKSLYLLEENGILGAISVVPENELNHLPCWQYSDAAEIARVAVAPSFQNKGLGLLLLQNLEKELASGGIGAVHLLVALKNLPALRLYEKSGYRQKGEKTEMYGNLYYPLEKELCPVRLFRDGEEAEVADLIATTITVCNAKDYPASFLKENIASHSSEVMKERARESHFYVAQRGKKIIGCGGITGYWGSLTESYLLSLFVLPEEQGKGIGSTILRALEKDEYATRAHRIEVGSSLTAVNFYRKLGYSFKNNMETPDIFGTVRLEKHKKENEQL